MPNLAQLTDTYYTDPVPAELPVEQPYLGVPADPDGLRRVYINTPSREALPGEVATTGRPEPRPEPGIEENPLEVWAKKKAEGASLWDNLGMAGVEDKSGKSENKLLKKLFGLGGEERYQLWPEKVLREGLAGAGEVMDKGTNLGLRREDVTDIPPPQMPTIDSTRLGKLLGIAPVAASPQDDIIEKAQAISALAGSGGLAGTTDATLGSAPFLRPALKYKDRLYKGKEGQQHMDVIPKELYPEFEKMAMSGEDISHYNFGFVNDKGQFLTREKALEYGINTGLIDPHAGKFGALTSTLMADSSKPGTAIEAVAKTGNWKIKGFEDETNWFHGTTHVFDKFSKAKGNVENYLGQAPHFSSNPKDASANYAGFGPDLTSRVERLAEDIFNKKLKNIETVEVGDDYGKIMTAARKEAAAKLAGGHEGAVIPVNLKLDNPVSLVEKKPTWIDFEGKWSKDGETYKESPNIIKLHNSLKKQGEKHGFDGQRAFDELAEKIELMDSVKAHEFDKALRSVDELMNAEHRSGKGMVGSDVIANVYKDLGYDGIVMDAKAAFPYMKDIPDGTLHAAPLKRNTVKSKLTDAILYADSSKEGAAIQANKPTFYSAVEHNLNIIPQAKMTGDQWLGTLSNKPGVKGEELDWTGLKSFLEENKGKPVTKEQIQEHLAANKVELKEVSKGGYMLIPVQGNPFENKQ